MIRFPGQSLLEDWRAARRFNALPDRLRDIVFYAEDGDSWPHFATIIRHLTGEGRHVCYLTSSRLDPVLQFGDPLVHAFCIGEGTVRTSMFLSLRAKVCVMTMPDLETFHLKRSRRQPVHYVYVFHSMVSTHMIYRKGAFDHFDTILCVGPHHVREISATEQVYGIRRKNLVYHGYGRLDTMLKARRRSERLPAPASNGDLPHVLVAPSWGPNGLLETHGTAVCGALLDAGFRVTVRPHPMTRRKAPGCIRAIESELGDSGRLTVENGVAAFDSLAAADCMVSDYSGAAMEFAFGFERPVLFVDVPRKVNNPEYKRIGIEPIEVAIREKIGTVVGPDRLTGLAREVNELVRAREEIREQIRKARGDVVYNVGASGRAAAMTINMMAQSKSGQGVVRG